MKFNDFLIKILFLLAGSTSVYAEGLILNLNQFSSDLSIHFRFDKDVFESEYMNNSHAISSIRNIFQATTGFDLIDSISIVAYASPEGKQKYNELLAKRRAEAIKRYILWKYPAFDSTLIHTYSKGENWDGLISKIEAATDLPSKDQILSLLREDNTAIREEKLRGFDGGRPWQYIEQNILPQLRVGAAFVIHYNPEKLKSLSAIPVDTYQLNILVDQVESLQPASIPYLLIKDNIGYRKPLFAFKTNLLADAMTFLNVEIEVPIGKRWSVGAEWMFPWWIFDNNKYYNQLLLGTVEGRYWFHTKRQSEVLSGHALGLYASAGYYDFQWKKKGYQGEILPSVGLSYTYAHKMGEYFRMEYSVGFGVFNTKYRKYTANDQYDQFPWLSSGRTIWVGPTKAEISFVWLISKRVRNEK